MLSIPLQKVLSSPRSASNVSLCTQNMHLNLTPCQNENDHATILNTVKDYSARSVTVNVKKFSENTTKTHENCIKKRLTQKMLHEKKKKMYECNAYHVMMLLGHPPPPASWIFQALSALRLFYTSTRIHAGDATKCYRTPFEDHWSTNLAGAVRNPACCVPAFHELSFQSLSNTGNLFSTCGGTHAGKRESDVLNPVDDL